MRSQFKSSPFKNSFYIIFAVLISLSSAFGEGGDSGGMNIANDLARTGMTATEACQKAFGSDSYSTGQTNASISCSVRRVASSNSGIPSNCPAGTTGQTDGTCLQNSGSTSNSQIGIQGDNTVVAPFPTDSGTSQTSSQTTTQCNCPGTETIVHQEVAPHQTHTQTGSGSVSQGCYATLVRDTVDLTQSSTTTNPTTTSSTGLVPGSVTSEQCTRSGMVLNADASGCVAGSGNTNTTIVTTTGGTDSGSSGRDRYRDRRDRRDERTETTTQTRTRTGSTTTTTVVGNHVFDENGNCISCGNVYVEKSNPWVEALGVIANPLAFLGSAYFGYKGQKAWANAYENIYATGYEECTNRFNSYLNYSLERGSNPILPEQADPLMQCNGVGIDGNFAGYGGVYGNGYGGVGGSPYLGAGYTPGFLGGMVGPYGYGAQGPYGGLGGPYGGLGGGVSIGLPSIQVGGQVGLGGFPGGYGSVGGYGGGYPGVYGGAGLGMGGGIYGGGLGGGLYGGGANPLGCVPGITGPVCTGGNGGVSGGIYGGGYPNVGGYGYPGAGGGIGGGISVGLPSINIGGGINGGGGYGYPNGGGYGYPNGGGQIGGGIYGGGGYGYPNGGGQIGGGIYGGGGYGQGGYGQGGYGQGGVNGGGYWGASGGNQSGQFWQQQQNQYQQFQRDNQTYGGQGRLQANYQARLQGANDIYNNYMHETQDYHRRASNQYTGGGYGGYYGGQAYAGANIGYQASYGGGYAF